MLLSSHLLIEVEAVADQLRDHRQRPDRRRGLARGAAGRHRHARARRPTPTRWRAALEAADLERQHVDDGGFVVDAEPEAVGRAALDGGVVLTHLGPSEGAGLEQLFFDLTASPTRSPPHDTPFPPVAPHPPGLDAVVELRKMVDTRAGFWLQLATALLTLAVRRRCSASSPTTDDLIFRDAVRARDRAGEHPAADRRDPARQLGVVAAHRADHVHARARSGCA